MTKEEAIEIIIEEIKDIRHRIYPDDMETTMQVSNRVEALNLAINCIQHCIDEEDSECYNCTDKHCDNCIYSGRL